MAEICCVNLTALHGSSSSPTFRFPRSDSVFIQSTSHDSNSSLAFSSPCSSFAGQYLKTVISFRHLRASRFSALAPLTIAANSRHRLSYNHQLQLRATDLNGSQHTGSDTNLRIWRGGSAEPKARTYKMEWYETNSIIDEEIVTIYR